MKIFKSLSKIAIPAYILFFGSCGEIDNILDENNNSYQYAISADNYTVTPFTTVTLNIEEYIFPEESYHGEIYGKDVELVKVTDTQLKFMMPYVPEGERVLEFIIEDVTHDVLFTIIALDEIENPDEIITNYRDNVIEAFEGLKTMNQQYNLDIEAQNLQVIEDYISDFNTDYASATAEEKQELAQFMNANPDIFDFSHFDYSIFDDSLTRSRGLIQWDQKLTGDMNYFTGLVIATGATTAIVNGALASLNPFAITISIAALAIEVALLKSHVKAMMKRTYKPFEFDINYEIKSSIVEFDNNVSYQLGIDATYRTLYQNDQNTSDATIELVANINTVTHYWNQVLENIPGTSGSVQNLNDIENYKVNSNSLAVTSNYITIGNISNSNVQITAFSNNNTVNVTFSTYLEQDIDFTFDIIYDNPLFDKVTKTINARLLADPCADDNETPIISDYTDTYTEGPLVRIFEFPFSDEGTGIAYNGSYSGACDVYNDITCYPVIVEFQHPSTMEWNIAANSYVVELIQGNGNNGVLKVKFDYFVDYDYRIFVRDYCGHMSSPVIFSKP